MLVVVNFARPANERGDPLPPTDRVCLLVEITRHHLRVIDACTSKQSETAERAEAKESRDKRRQTWLDVLGVACRGAFDLALNHAHRVNLAHAQRGRRWGGEGGRHLKCVHSMVPGLTVWVDVRSRLEAHLEAHTHTAWS